MVEKDLGDVCGVQDEGETFLSVDIRKGDVSKEGKKERIHDSVGNAYSRRATFLTSLYI